MAKEYIITDKTFEDAMAQAQAQYPGENVQYEILEMPKRGIFGIGASPAKIKVIVNDPEEPEEDLSSIVSSIKGLKVSTDKGGDGSAPEKKQPPKQDKPKQKPERQQAQKQERPAAAKPAAPAAAPAETAEAPARAQSAQHTAPFVEKELRVIEITDAERDHALRFLDTLLQDMGVDAKAEFVGSVPSGIGGNSYPRIEISGEGAGVLIGHHGETLDAIQFLTNLCTHRKSGERGGDFVKIIVDIESYRRKREDTLRSLARRQAAKAQKLRRDILLEPMNPFERRIIHSEIQGMENVSTHSVGRDENRRVEICYEGPGKVERRRRGGSHRRGGAPRKDAPAEPAEAVETTAEAAEE